MVAIPGSVWFGVSQVLLFFGLWLILWLPIVAILLPRIRWQPFHPTAPTQKIPLVLSLYAIAPLASYAILRYYHLSWVAIGLRSIRLLGPSFGVGLMLGLGSFLALFGFYVGVGWANWELSWSHENSDDQNLNQPLEQPSLLQSITTKTGLFLALLLLSGVVGFSEELVFRGFITSRLATFSDVRLAGAIASLIFALLHLVWDVKGTFPQLPGLWMMGLVLTVAWWVDHQSIGLAWGLHSGWVWAIATVDSFGLIHYRETAPTWGVGIDKQPLASIPGLIALIIVGIWMKYFLNLS
ncbi:MAG: lysostaphin resistance A-like protein [Leptolyngbyaceae cyanobacterium]